MRAFRWPGDPVPAFHQSVATLGVFDGVHVGHEHILREVVCQARARGAVGVVITLDRHPHRVLHGLPEPFITSLEHRLRLFEELGLDYCMIIRFTPQVAEMGAADFARAVFRDLLHARLIILGFDCRFGRNREGDGELCRKMSGELGLEALIVPPVTVAGEVVSSTAIRQAIEKADLAAAAQLLGRPFSLFGTVVRGARRGHVLGYPTANLDVHNELLPKEGVYATRAFLEGKALASVTSIGAQQTFEAQGETEAAVEVHIMDSDLDLYGRDVEVQFVKWLRAQRRFASAEALAEQIAADVAQARQALARREAP